jgi:hypothetical protein
MLLRGDQGHGRPSAVVTLPVQLAAGRFSEIIAYLARSFAIPVAKDGG